MSQGQSTWPWQRLNERNAGAHETLATLLGGLPESSPVSAGPAAGSG
jgi:hypothetical protein